jgi:hypothetical protein
MQLDFLFGLTLLLQGLSGIIPSQTNITYADTTIIMEQSVTVCGSVVGQGFNIATRLLFAGQHVMLACGRIATSTAISHVGQRQEQHARQACRLSVEHAAAGTAGSALAGRLARQGCSIIAAAASWKSTWPCLAGTAGAFLRVLPLGRPRIQSLQMSEEQSHMSAALLPRSNTRKRQNPLKESHTRQNLHPLNHCSLAQKSRHQVAVFGLAGLLFAGYTKKWSWAARTGFGKPGGRSCTAPKSLWPQSAPKT